MSISNTPDSSMSSGINLSDSDYSNSSTVQSSDGKITLKPGQITLNTLLNKRELLPLPLQNFHDNIQKNKSNSFTQFFTQTIPGISKNQIERDAQEIADALKNATGDDKITLYSIILSNLSQFDDNSAKKLEKILASDVEIFSAQKVSKVSNAELPPCVVNFNICDIIFNSLEKFSDEEAREKIYKSILNFIYTNHEALLELKSSIPNLENRVLNMVKNFPTDESDTNFKQIKILIEFSNPKRYQRIDQYSKEKNSAKIFEEIFEFAKTDTRDTDIINCCRWALGKILRENQNAIFNLFIEGAAHDEMAFVLYYSFLNHLDLLDNISKQAFGDISIRVLEWLNTQHFTGPNDKFLQNGTCFCQSVAKKILEICADNKIRGRLSGEISKFLSKNFENIAFSVQTKKSAQDAAEMLPTDDTDALFALEPENPVTKFELVIGLSEPLIYKEINELNAKGDKIGVCEKIVECMRRNPNEQNFIKHCKWALGKLVPQIYASIPGNHARLDDIVACMEFKDTGFNAKLAIAKQAPNIYQEISKAQEDGDVIKICSLIKDYILQYDPTFKYDTSRFLIEEIETLLLNVHQEQIQNNPETVAQILDIALSLPNDSFTLALAISILTGKPIHEQKNTSKLQLWQPIVLGIRSEIESGALTPDTAEKLSNIVKYSMLGNLADIIDIGNEFNQTGDTVEQALRIAEQIDLINDTGFKHTLKSMIDTGKNLFKTGNNLIDLYNLAVDNLSGLDDHTPEDRYLMLGFAEVIKRAILNNSLNNLFSNQQNNNLEQITELYSKIKQILGLPSDSDLSVEAAVERKIYSYSADSDVLVYNLKRVDEAAEKVRQNPANLDKTDFLLSVYEQIIDDYKNFNVNSPEDAVKFLKKSIENSIMENQAAFVEAANQNPNTLIRISNIIWETSNHPITLMIAIKHPDDWNDMQQNITQGNTYLNREINTLYLSRQCDDNFMETQHNMNSTIIPELFDENNQAALDNFYEIFKNLRSCQGILGNVEINFGEVSWKQQKEGYDVNDEKGLIKKFLETTLKFCDEDPNRACDFLKKFIAQYNIPNNVGGLVPLSTILNEHFESRGISRDRLLNFWNSQNATHDYSYSITFDKDWNMFSSASIRMKHDDQSFGIYNRLGEISRQDFDNTSAVYHIETLVDLKDEVQPGKGSTNVKTDAYVRAWKK